MNHNLKEEMPQRRAYLKMPYEGNEKHRQRGWCFTFNNYTAPDINMVKNIVCRYMCFGYEVAPETGTPHLQGYVYFDEARTWMAMTKIKLGHVTPSVHDYAAVKYCKKTSDFWQKGREPRQGKRSDLDEMAQSILAGDITVDDIVEECPSLFQQFGRTFCAVEDARLRKQRTEGVKQAVWYYGQCDEWEKYFPPFDLKKVFIAKGEYWCGYNGQETVIIRDGGVSTKMINQLCGAYPTFVNRKGRGSIPCTSTFFIITSDECPCRSDRRKFISYVDVQDAIMWPNEFNPPPVW